MALSEHPDDPFLRELGSHHQWLVARLRKQISDPEEAEDVAQEALMRAVAQIRHGQGKPFASEDHFRNWLQMAARNILIDAHRRQARRPAASLEEPGLSPAERASREIDPRQPDPGIQAANDEVLQLVQAMFGKHLASLDDRERAVVQGRLEGKTYLELARATGRSVGWCHGVVRDFKGSVAHLLGDALGLPPEEGDPLPD